MPEDRDQLFERALARHLRTEGAGESLCLDPETLAAYHERMLSPEELSSAKSHIVSCARCQDVLARLEATQEANDLQEVFEEAPAGASRPEMFPGQARQTVREAHAEKPSKAVVALPRKRGFTLRWAAPAGAIAAALLIWLGVRDSRILDKHAPEPTTQVAENRQQLPSSPPREESKEFSLPQDKELGMLQDVEKQKSGGSAGRLNEAMPRTRGEAAPPPFLDEKKDSAVFRKLEREKKASPAYEYSMRNGVVANSRGGPSAAAAQAQANNALQRGDQGVAGGAAQMVEVAPAPGDLDKAQAQTPTAKSDALVTAKSVPPPPPPPSPSRDHNQPAASADDSRLKAKNAGVGGAEVTGAFTIPALSRAVSKISLDIRIVAPGGKTIWSVGPGGQIFRSSDGGRMWLLQIGGVAANLTGGSAPSDKVCWIAGAAGTLLRTTDSGLHWQEIRTPISGDLGGVHAADAKHASIWDAANHLSYETSDGGKTWKQSANE